MSTQNKLQSGSHFPSLSLPKVGGGDVKLGGNAGWQMLVVYCGKRCPQMQEISQGSRRHAR
jgi:hypothetical protein